MVSIDTFASVGSMIAFRDKANGVIVKRNLGYFLNVTNQLEFQGGLIRCGPINLVMNITDVAAAGQQ
jgi:hypothetical protein